MIYITVQEFSELRGYTPRYIKRLITNGVIFAKETLNDHNRKKYIIPLTELSEAEQLRYYRLIGVEAPEELTTKKRSDLCHRKTMEEFSADEREEIADWIRIIHEWEEFCEKSKLQKVAATEKFVQLKSGVSPDLRISKGILYRKKAALKADNLAGLLDNRGSWEKGTSSIPDVAWECFMSFYLDEAQHPIQACLEYTEMWLRQEAPQYLPLPSYASSIGGFRARSRSRWRSWGARG